MKGKTVVLYSSAVAFLLIALSAWLTLSIESPENASLDDLSVIKAGLQNVVMSENEVVSNNSNDTSVSVPVAVPVDPEPISTVMGWWYPGNPACESVVEASSYNLDVVKPEYFVIRDGGSFELMTEETYGCNGYSPENAAVARNLAPEQFVMVSASYAPDMHAFLLKDAKTNEYTEQLVSLVVDESFTGIELDFEDFSGWTPEIYDEYKSFIIRLGNKLHSAGKELMLDVPATRNDVEEQWYQLRLNELEQLPVDYIVVMAYDYQYDHGVGKPVSPIGWLTEVVSFSRSKLSDKSKLVIGLPSYGYKANKKTARIQIINAAQAEEHVLYGQTVRDKDSLELIAESDTEVLVYQDSVSIQAKVDAVSKAGVGKISIWHLGGNPWFSQ